MTDLETLHTQLLKVQDELTRLRERVTRLENKPATYVPPPTYGPLPCREGQNNWFPENKWTKEDLKKWAKGLADLVEGNKK